MWRREVLWDNGGLGKNILVSLSDEEFQGVRQLLVSGHKRQKQKEMEMDFEDNTWPSSFIPQKKLACLPSPLFLLLIFLIWPALALGQIFTSYLNSHFAEKDTEDEGDDLHSHHSWPRLQASFMCSMLCFPWHHPASPGGMMRTHWPWGRGCDPDIQRKWQGMAHNPKELKISVRSSSGKAFLLLSLLQVPFLWRRLSSCSRVLGGGRGGVSRLEGYVLSFTASCYISVLANWGPFFSLQQGKAKEATGFLNYSLIWPQSSPLHKYSLICSLGSQEKKL